MTLRRDVTLQIQSVYRKSDGFGSYIATLRLNTALLCGFGITHRASRVQRMRPPNGRCERDSLVYVGHVMRRGSFAS
jgi:hypothetical protein